MPEFSTAADMEPAREPQIEAVLAAWHDATVRLEKTHSALRSEVARLTDELELKNRELARKERLADLGQMASHVAHEVRNNLVPVALYLSLLRRRLSDDPGSLDILEKVGAGVRALDATVNDLLSFTAERDPQLRSFRVREVVDEVLDSLEPQLAAQGIQLNVDVPPVLAMRADRDMLRRAVLNLVLNALDAMPDGGELVITGVASPWGCELEVADSGPGLSDEALRRACEPFFTTKSGGTGLGLAIVQRLVDVHGGELQVRNCPEGGASFTLVMPHRCMEAAA